ncbi:glycosyltransferase family 9 protein [Flavobacterium sp.]|uniref:glycosyltransferase family 9 protein n=1 Tax=Flavobacterium sp. TaxID=239 RepID=UPI00286CA962|nr:glycosyltransferase family 9 protein [Flavobacterium sp.]
MSLKIKINAFRRNAMHSITKSIGKSNSNTNVGTIDPTQIKRVLILRPNHRLGNLLLITPLVQEVEKLFPNCKIDLFIKGNLGPIVFENYQSIDQIIRLPKKHFDELGNYFQGWLKLKNKKYDLAINADKNSSSGRLSLQLAKATFKCFGDLEIEVMKQEADYSHIAKYPVYDLRNYLSKTGMVVPSTNIPNLLLKLSEAEIAKGKSLLYELVPNNKKTICLFTFATGAKCYSVAWWAVFYERLKKEFPEYNLIEVLPVENVSQINFEAPSYYSKDIREITAFLKNTSLFIGADSGMMHLASAAQIPIVGLFSVTTIEKYAPYNSKSVAIQTEHSGIDEWIQTIKNVLQSK